MLKALRTTLFVLLISQSICAASQTPTTKSEMAQDAGNEATSNVQSEQADSNNVGSEDAQTEVKKDNIFKRIINYFETSNEDHTFDKAFDLTIVGGVGYSDNSSLSLGVVAAGLYRLDRSDTITPPSNVSLFGTASIIGQFAVGLEGNTIWRNSKHKLDYKLTLSATPRDLWGVGYDAGRYNPKSTFDEDRIDFQTRYLYGVKKSFYVGALLNFQSARGDDFTQIEYIYGQRREYTSTGIGAIVEYDSRDFIPNPYKGVYISMEYIIFPESLGNCDATLWRTRLTLNAYQRLWEGGILAGDIYAENNSKDTPWPMLARMGGSYRMRGYYQGQYTDNAMITAQVELRQRVWRRIGVVAWGGAGNVFPDFKNFNLSQTLPNYGIGLRWELKKRVNVRIDYGFGRHTSGLMLNINEAF